ncbi:MAG: hypothetical protein KIT25_06760 [Enhydrobacter sp.]|nr:MAG: hypothetical protein KIT25_06760 [Enhydrobacter sp.]
MKLRTLILLVVGLLVVVGAGGYAAFKFFSPAERTLADMRKMPLVGLLIDDVPGAADRLRKAIEDERRQPTVSGPPRPQLVIAELRRDHIAPALRGADDASAIAAMAARAALVAHLEKTNLPACREFSLGGIQHVDRLDAEGQRLFNAVLKSLENAYRNSRANGGKALPAPTAAQLGDWLREAGFQKVDFDRLNSFATLSNGVSCEIELKVNQLPPKLPPEKQGPFSRFVIAN